MSEGRSAPSLTLRVVIEPLLAATPLNQHNLMGPPIFILTVFLTGSTLFLTPNSIRFGFCISPRMGQPQLSPGQSAAPPWVKCPPTRLRPEGAKRWQRYLAGCPTNSGLNLFCFQPLDCIRDNVSIGSFACNRNTRRAACLKPVLTDR